MIKIEIISIGNTSKMRKISIHSIIIYRIIIITDILMVEILIIAKTKLNIKAKGIITIIMDLIKMVIIDQDLNNEIYR